MTRSSGRSNVGVDNMRRSGSGSSSTQTSITDSVKSNTNRDGSGTSTSSFVARVLLNTNTIDANRDTLNEAIKQAQNRSGYRKF